MHTTLLHPLIPSSNETLMIVRLADGGPPQIHGPILVAKHAMQLLVPLLPLLITLPPVVSRLSVADSQLCNNALSGNPSSFENPL